MTVPAPEAGVIAADIAAITPEWLSAALADQLGGARVVAVDPSPIGTGQMAASWRLRLDYDRPGAGPATVVAKLPAADPTSRATGLALRSYEIEVRYYQQVAPTVQVRSPGCFHGAVDTATGDFVLLLEDLAPAEQGDQLAGCSPDRAAVAVAELPKLHAPRWGDTRLESLDWLNRSTADASAFTAQLVGGLWPGFCERYTGRVDDDIMAMGARFMPGIGSYLGARSGPLTVAHGDYRLDNLLFGQGDGCPEVAVVDWQTVTLGSGVGDLSYFVGAGLQPEHRRAHEEDLVRLYQQGMAARGVELGWDELWEQYRRLTFGGFVMAVAASMLVEQTARGDQMFITMAQRHGRHVLDLEAETLLGA